jgi:hypothetical protein
VGGDDPIVAWIFDQAVLMAGTHFPPEKKAR